MEEGDRVKDGSLRPEWNDLQRKRLECFLTRVFPTPLLSSYASAAG